jgi:hypothetical protein
VGIVVDTGSKSGSVVDVGGFEDPFLDDSGWTLEIKA